MDIVGYFLDLLAHVDWHLRHGLCRCTVPGPSPSWRWSSSRWPVWWPSPSCPAEHVGALAMSEANAGGLSYAQTAGAVSASFLPRFRYTGAAVTTDLAWL